jgi:DsbC/DsbD-like thiol-disulfide interchange protein
MSNRTVGGQRGEFPRSSTISLLLAILALAWVSFAPRSRAYASVPQNDTMPSASSVVKPRVFVSLDPVPREKEFQVAIVVDIARGFHMNSHHPTDPYLIPTSVTPQLPTGVELLDTIYPAGKLERFTFSPDKPLDVYTGSVTLRLRLKAGASASLGAASFPVTLRYQACNDAACLPPVKVPVSVKFQVVAAGAAARALHPELFPAALSKK